MNIFKKSLVAAVATGVILTSTGIGMGVAVATPGATKSVPGASNSIPNAPVGTINRTAPPSLTIHKFSKNNVGTERDNGLRRDNVNGLGEPLRNAVFQVQKVNNIDLTTNEGWLAAEKVVKTGSNDLGPAVTKPTGANGEAVFDGLAVGLYKVTEISAPLGYESVEREFYVTLPLTNPNTKNTWEYNVHVYPKNKPVEDVITKTVQDQGKNVGDRIGYTITSKIPESQKLASYKVADVYDPARLTDGHIKSVKLADNSVTFNEGVDYAVRQENAAGKAKLVIDFTAAGLAKISNLPAQKRKLVTVADFMVQHVNSVDPLAPVVNDAELTSYSEHEDPTNPKPPSTPKDKPKTYFGNVKVVKQNSDKQPLNEARFDIYACDDINHLGNKIRTDVVPGATVQGLHVNDFADGAAVENQAEKAKGYCLVETKAHPGYSLLATPFFFQVNKGSNETIALSTPTVTDAKHNGGHNLPLTGGAGITTLILAGGLIVLVGGGSAVYMFRRQGS